MVRIALVSTPFLAVPPRGYGGTELVVHELVRGLEAAGHDVTLFATGDSRARDLRYLYDAPVWPPDRDAELRHCGAAARAIAGELGSPLVYTLHHARDDRLTQAYLRRPSVHYVAISARQAQLEPELACEVVHHGLDPERHPLGHGEGDYALFLGRLSPCKAPQVAVAAARAAHVPIRLAGEVHFVDAAPEWKAELGAALADPNVLYVGPVGGERKMQLLGGARAL